MAEDLKSPCWAKLISYESIDTVQRFKKLEDSILCKMATSICLSRREGGNESLTSLRVVAVLR
jgi:hypothetical protein